MVALASLSCGDAAPRADDRSAPDSAAVSDSLEGAADTTADSTSFAERIVVFMEATSEQIERARGQLSAEDFAIMADDLMFYRSAAHEYLQQRSLPIKTFDGRRSLRFMVNGTMRELDVTDVPFLDVIVLYETGRQPKVIAPVDIGETAEYFPNLRTSSVQ
jgi:hypothetical protein